MPEIKRRREDESWIKNHHILASFIGFFVGVTAYAFTTFATIKYVDSRDAEIREIMNNQNRQVVQSIDNLSRNIEEYRKNIINILTRKDR